MTRLYVDVAGAGPRLVLVHGSATPAARAWKHQRPLAERFTVVVPHRSGYAPNRPVASSSFDDDAGEIAELLADGAHLVGHSYGGVVSLLAAARRPAAVRSLTVVEPPAFGLARGHPSVEAFLARVVRAPREPRAYLEFFLLLVGAPIKLDDPLPPALENAARAAMAERPPHEAEIPLETLAAAPFPKLVVSGAHHAAFDAVCEVLAERLGAERAVVAGGGHSIPGLGAPFNERLEKFIARKPRAVE